MFLLPVRAGRLMLDFSTFPSAEVAIAQLSPPAVRTLRVRRDAATRVGTRRIGVPGEATGTRRWQVVPQQEWSKKRERQYEHIKDSAEERGAGEDRAEEIAARTVNKNRAQSGESRQASRTSTDDVSPQHRGGKRSHSGAQGRTKAQLYEDAKRRHVKGRSTMTKAQLQDAVDG